MSECYPELPGFKASGTSEQSAAAINEDAASLRAMCLECVQLHGDMTADEAAEKLKRSVLSIRPRFSEMLRLGWIFDAGKRRPNISGHKATVWSINPHAKLF